MKVRIYYHHTDSGGVVYYAKYLEFLEEARTEFLKRQGISIKELAKKGILFVVIRQEIDYKSPAFYGDTLKINTRLKNIYAVKIEIENEIRNQSDQIVATAKTVLACVDQNIKPRSIPKKILRKLT